MKKMMKLLVLGVVVAFAVSVGAVYANDATKPANTTAAVVVKVKLSQNDVTKIALAAHKNAQVLKIQLNNKIYTVKISTAKENRTLLIGGNTGKILKDAVDAAPVVTPKAATTPTSKSK